jgi:hypothetical protein
MTSPAIPRDIPPNYLARLLDAAEGTHAELMNLTHDLREVLTLLEAATGMSRHGYPLDERTPR